MSNLYNKSSSINIGGSNINTISTPYENASLKVLGNEYITGNTYMDGNLNCKGHLNLGNET